jgi:hypothetical protein
MINPQEEHYIKNAEPNTDCIYCVVRHYRNSEGDGFAAEQYAECECPAVCKGLTSMDITFKPDSFGTTTSCQNCKHYKGKSQLTLF